MKKMMALTAMILMVNACGTSKGIGSAERSIMLTTLNLKNVVDDKVAVSIDPGVFNSDAITFYIPKTIPGTYSSDNYGQYIDGLKAIDYKGNEMVVKKTDQNSWHIMNAKALDKITYLVNDTYDSETQIEKPVFSPAGTNILKGENFMLNLHGFIGYFEGLKEVPYEIQITAPANLEPTTTLSVKPKDTDFADQNIDIFTATRYFEVIDNPILYAPANTASFKLNDIEVRLSVYSPTGVYKAADLKEEMQKMMSAQKTFLGDINSTKKYDILLYLSKLDATDAGSFGALEHHTSTTVVLPEAMPKDRLEQTMIDVVSHEFFHTVTPLNVHSKEVQYFDFNNPKMSRHLWMYEGTTEYFANLFQIQQGLIDESEFYQRMMNKITNAKTYDDTMSFTTMSQNILEPPYEKNYANVYEKGALINMVLDIELRRLSGGEKGVLWLMKELSKKYGQNTPFEDADLIDEIVALTYPEIGAFFDKHVIGETPIDYKAYLNKVGLNFKRAQQETGYFLNGEVPFIDVDPAHDNVVFVRKGITLSSFYTELGIEGGDVIKSINKTPINLESIRPLIVESFTWAADKEITVEVERAGELLTLKGEAGTPTLNVTTIVPTQNISPQAAELREVWLRG